MKKHKRKIFASIFGLVMLAGIATSASLASTSNNNANTTLVANTQSSTQTPPLSGWGMFDTTGKFGLEQSSSNSTTEIDWSKQNSTKEIYFDNGFAYTSSDKKVLLGMDPSSEQSSITIPASVVEIKGYTKVSSSGTTTVKNKVGAFEGVNALTNVTIEGTDVRIEKDAFKNCSNLTSVNITNNGVKFIGESAFEGCTLLESINLPSALSSIGNNAFKSTDSLESIELPSNLSKIGKSAFEGSGLTSLNLAGTKVKTIEEKAFKNCRSLANISFSNSTQIIGESAFEGTAVSTLNINSNLTSLGVASFKNCTNLTSFNFTNRKVKLTSLPDSIFEGCSSLTTINVGSNPSLKTIGSKALKSTKIKSLDLTSTLTIGESAFEDCTSLESLTNANVLSFIGNSAFKNSSLKEITPKRVSEANSNVDLQQVVRIEDYAFYGTNISTVTTGRSLNYIGNGSFKSINTLTSVDFRSSRLLVKNVNAFDTNDQSKVKWPSSFRNIFRKQIIV